MPYFITNKSANCSGWAVTKEDGEIMGCHKTKAGAVAQMVAVSLAEDMEPGGERALNQRAPEYMRNAAKRGLAYYEEGKGGSGLVPRTIREARLMANGEVSDDKWVRIAAWIARHMPDLDAPAADPNSDDYPSAGVVAHLLWGSGPSKSQAERALAFAQSVVEKIRAEQRGLNDPVAIIVDVDDTLIHMGQPMRAVIDAINAMDGRKIVITARPVSQREETIKQLREAGFNYTALFLKDSDMDTPAWKASVAQRLLGRYNIVLAIDNDEDNRDAFEALGIDAESPEDVIDMSQDEDPEEHNAQVRWRTIKNDRKATSDN